MIPYHNLLDQNPWWQDPDFRYREASWPRRQLFSKIHADLQKDMAVLLTGLRRTGKSTILRQLIADLLAEGSVPPERILSFSFDKYAVDKTPDALESVITSFLERRLHKKIFEITSRAYLFIDEIQYVDYWQDIVKRYYDQNKNLKFILTGSQSTKLKGKSRESLAGRLIEYFLPVLDYREYLRICGRDIPVSTIWDFGLTGFDALHDYYYSHSSELKAGLPNYLCYGQFPEIATTGDDIRFAYEYIREAVLGKILEQDIPLHYRIEKVQPFKAMAYHLLINSGSFFEIKNIGSELGLAKTTAEKYLVYLREGFLVGLLHQYTRSEIKKGRLLKKAYATSANFIAAVSNYQPDYYDNVPEIFGKLIETYVWQRLTQRFGKVSLWRRGEKEIDFLIPSAGEEQQFLPLEVKFSNRIRDRELKTILTFADKKQCPTVIIATKDLLAQKKFGGILTLFVPYYLL